MRKRIATSREPIQHGGFCNPLLNGIEQSGFYNSYDYLVFLGRYFMTTLKR